MTENNPLIIAVAPNGARHKKADFAEVPITINELADTAEQCANAGATMIHLHVRNSDETHSLEPNHYQRALTTVNEAVAERMLVQVTSEAAGKYNAEQQMALMLQLSPGFLSVGLREYITDPADVTQFGDFIQTLYGSGSLIQYIIYDAQDYALYQQLIMNQIIPTDRHSLLVVVGRYLKSAPDLDTLTDYASLLEQIPDSMICTFGAHSPAILMQCASNGHHVRLGFENSRCMSDDRIAQSNAELVADFVTNRIDNRALADYQSTLRLLGG